LAERPGGPETDTLVLHVENCRRCQDRLEQLTSAANHSIVRLAESIEDAHLLLPRPEFLARLQQVAPRPAWLAPASEDAAEDSRSTARWPQVDGYEILGELGRGAMGVVYRARQRSLNRLVALKMILDGEYAGPEQVTRFRREAELIARLQHPNVVQIYDVGEQDGRPFFAMELVEGGSLVRLLAGTPQDTHAAAQLIQTLARAIHAAHQLGIVHRDLKPANILLAFSRAPPVSADSALAGGARLNTCVTKITDFGLAKQLVCPAEPGERTGSGTIMGSPSYMAPEQALAQSATVGPAADIYSLGAILYELLTGRPPFRAESPLETILQVRHEEPVPPRRLRPKLARDLETICLTCLRKEPHRRYPSAEALAEDLRRFRAGEPIQARPIGTGERVLKWVQRRPALAALAAVSMVATLCLLAGAAWYNGRLRESNVRLQDEVQQRQTQQERAAANLHTALDVVEHELIKVKSARELGYVVPEPLARDLLTHAVEFYQNLLTSATDADPQVRRARGRAYFGLGLSAFLLNHSPEAESHYREAVQVQENLRADFPDNVDYRIDLATTLVQWSWQQQGSVQSATQSMAAALVESLSPEHPRLANMGVCVSCRLAGQGRYREALPWLDRHIRVIETLQPRAQPDRTPQFRRILFEMYRTRALILDTLGEYQQALASVDQALALGDVGDVPYGVGYCRMLRALTLAQVWADYLRGGPNLRTHPGESEARH
jgi:serine/threonine protein kinase